MMQDFVFNFPLIIERPCIAVYPAHDFTDSDIEQASPGITALDKLIGVLAQIANVCASYTTTCSSDGIYLTAENTIVDALLLVT